MEAKLGFHVGKSPTYTKTIQDVLDSIKDNVKNFPIQIFTGSTKTWKRANVNEKDIHKAKELIIKNNMSVFIHSIYLINLSRFGEEFEKAKECLEYDLKIGPMLGAKGVVVHVGKALKMGTEKAVDNMFKNILNMLDSIDESCPLLIETPAGQGTEVLSDIDSFISFYNKFSDFQKTKLKICIDTCHIFACGYQPDKYLEKWNEECPGSIVLVHYNDSKCACGSRKDRHAPIGEGLINIETLDYIVKWCTVLDIPMVREF